MVTEPRDDEVSEPAEPPQVESDAQGTEVDAARGLAQDQERPRRRGGRRRRVCIMCAEKMKTVDYKDVGFLRRFVSDRGRIETRRRTSACAKHQRALASAIKRARQLALIPYTPEHIRGAGFGHR